MTDEFLGVLDIPTQVPDMGGQKPLNEPSVNNHPTATVEQIERETLV